MNDPVEAVGTSTSQIVISFTQLTDLATGGNNITITSYHVQIYDTTNSVWVDVVGQSGSPSLNTTITYSSGVQGGVSYTFRV